MRFWVHVQRVSMCCIRRVSACNMHTNNATYKVWERVTHQKSTATHGCRDGKFVIAVTTNGKTNRNRDRSLLNIRYTVGICIRMVRSAKFSSQKSVPQLS